MPDDAWSPSGAILGIWDGHDSGVALIQDSSVRFAANEERYTRRKLDVGFPRHALEACLTTCRASDVRLVAISTCDVARTISRLFPASARRYYKIRRRLGKQPISYQFERTLKGLLTRFPPNSVTRAVSRTVHRRALREFGIGDVPIVQVPHHVCHAATAAMTCSLEPVLVVTLDGVGDAVAGTVGVYSHGEWSPLATIPCSSSLGLFYEHVTTLLNMRELEDEGKVMAMAAYAPPISSAPLQGLFEISDLRIRARHSGHRLYRHLAREHWSLPAEQFACAAQRTVERAAAALMTNAVARTTCRRVAVSGGLFANVKLNMLLRALDDVDSLYVFPHMGDGGLALGAALEAAREHAGLRRVQLDITRLGPSLSAHECEEALRCHGLPFERPNSPASRAAQLIANRQVVAWCGGEMEYGPRALGHRSILARADDPSLKDELNSRFKRRSWYQPFCPSMLAGEAPDHLVCPDVEHNRWMTMAHQVRLGARQRLEAVCHVDGTCRPHFVEPNEAPLVDLLLELRRLVGIGVVLNTSFNLHGEPLVRTAEDACRAFVQSGLEHMILGPFHVQRST